MSEGKIKGIYIAAKAGDGISGHEKVLIRAGKGIVGDRYYSETGKNRSNYKGQPDWEITLIESEVVENFNSATGNTFHESDFRRNVVTEGIRLNDLVGKTLQKRLAYKILPDLVGKGGLRAQIRGAGIIAVGDSIES